MRVRVLVITGEPNLWETLNGVLSGCGADPVHCETLCEATELLASERFALVILEESLPDGTSLDLLIAAIRRSGPSIPVIVVSRLDDWGGFLDAMVAGAFDYVAFPPHPHELERAVTAALAETVSNRKVEVGAAA
jgi:DNA-binding NtrC family response regulator